MTLIGRRSGDLVIARDRVIGKAKPLTAKDAEDAKVEKQNLTADKR